MDPADKPPSGPRAPGSQARPGTLGRDPAPGGGPDGRLPEDFRVTAPTVSLPKGGGAIQGIGEKVTANPVTGSATVLLPLPLTPGRGGVTPALSLSYDSGAGNGPFGQGFRLSIPSIRHKTDKGLPRYLDADTFLLSDAEGSGPSAYVALIGQHCHEGVQCDRAKVGHGFPGTAWLVPARSPGRPTATSRASKTPGSRSTQTTERCPSLTSTAWTGSDTPSSGSAVIDAWAYIPGLNRRPVVSGSETNTGARRRSKWTAAPTASTRPSVGSATPDSRRLTAAPSRTNGRSRSKTSTTTHRALGSPITTSGSLPGPTEEPIDARRSRIWAAIGARTVTSPPGPAPTNPTAARALASCAVASATRVSPS
jgi:hypothetical protein